MKVTQFATYPNTSIPASTTGYVPFANGGTTQSAESAQRIRYRTAGTLSNLTAVITANNRGASTIRSRVNGANGNMLLSIGASGTGEFTDSTNTDSIAVADAVNAQIVVGSGGSQFTMGMLYTCFSATTDSMIRWNNMRHNNATASTTTYYSVGGGSNENNGHSTTEADTQTKIKTTATIKHLWLHISANTRSGSSTTYGSRLNGANGNLSISVGASGTGDFQDTSNSDSVVSGDNYNLYSTTGTGTGTITNRCFSVECVTTNNEVPIVAGNSLTSPNTLAASATVYTGLGGGIHTDATETDFRADAGAAYSLKNLALYVSANSITANSTVRTRKNGANGNILITIGSSATGWFEDTTNTDSVTATDEMNYEMVGGATGTSLTITTAQVVAYLGYRRRVIVSGFALNKLLIISGIISLAVVVLTLKKPLEVPTEKPIKMPVTIVQESKQIVPEPLLGGSGEADPYSDARTGDRRLRVQIR